MFAALLTLLSALRVPTISVMQNAGDAKLCFDESATSTSSHADRKTIAAYATRSCPAAVSFGTNIIERKKRVRGRQIGNVISSIAGEVTAILASNDITIPTAVITSAINGVIQTLEPSASTADVTGIASSIEAAASSAASVSPSHLASATRTSTITTKTAEPVVPSTASSKPSSGIVIGTVLGGVGVLALLGILIMLILRHKRRRASSQTPVDKEASPSPSFSDPNRISTLISTATPTFDADTPTLPGCTLAGSPVVPGGGAAGYDPYTFASHTLHQQPGSQHHNPYTEEKVEFHMQSQRPHGNEMSTNANIWELDGKEMPQHPQELGTADVACVYQAAGLSGRGIFGDCGGEDDGTYSRAALGDVGKQGQKGETSLREREYCGSPVSPVSPIVLQRKF